MSSVAENIFEPERDEKAEKELKRERRRLEEEKRKQEAAEAEEKDAIRRGYRGRRALSGGSLTGFGNPTLFATV